MFLTSKLRYKHTCGCIIAVGFMQVAFVLCSFCCFYTVFVYFMQFVGGYILYFCIKPVATMTKHELRNLYPGLSYRNFIKPVINLIISKRRNVDFATALQTKTITTNEFYDFVELVGKPIDKDMDVLDHTPTKDYLIGKFAQIPVRDLLAEINEVIREHRQYDDDMPVYEKRLTPKEYEALLERII